MKKFLCVSASPFSSWSSPNLQGDFQPLQLSHAKSQPVFLPFTSWASPIDDLAPAFIADQRVSTLLGKGLRPGICYTFGPSKSWVLVFESVLPFFSVALLSPILPLRQLPQAGRSVLSLESPFRLLLPSYAGVTSAEPSCPHIVDFAACPSLTCVPSPPFLQASSASA